MDARKRQSAEAVRSSFGCKDARATTHGRVATLVARAALLALMLVVSMGAQRRSSNFIIETSDASYAEQVAQAAERYRHDLAVEWLGKPMPNWAQPCVMTVQVGPHLGAGGATTFVFDKGEVFGWRMSIQGSQERVLDSVLPHEITHMIYASHFRQPLPRWADEGGATSVEHASERNKQRNMLVEFLRTGRGIAFNKMFAMTEYPRDIMPLYAQGYSLAEYLIQTGGRRKYVEFLGDGLENDDWAGAVERHYGIKNLGTLQNTWLAWVQQGMPPLKPRETTPVASGEMLAANERRPRPEPNLIYHIHDKQQDVAPIAALVPVRMPNGENAARPQTEAGPAAIAAVAPPRKSVSPDRWLDASRAISPPADRIAVVDPRSKPAVIPAAGWHMSGEPGTAAVGTSSTPPSTDPFSTQVARPQPMQQAR